MGVIQIFKNVNMGEPWIRKFAVIWTGQFISLLSSTAVNFAIIIWLSLETRSAEVLAFAAIAGLLPQALIGVAAGVYVDRWNKKRTMIISDSMVAVFTLGLSIAFSLGYNNVLLIYCVLALRSIGSAFHMPAMQATAPLLAPKTELLRIAGVNQLLQSGTIIGGPALGALLVGNFDIGHVLLLDVLGAGLAIASLLLVKFPEDQKNKLISGKIHPVNLFLRDLITGYDAIKDNGGLKALFFVSLGTAFFMIPIGPLLPLITLDHFNGGKFEMSVIEIIWGVGMFIGSFVLTLIKPKNFKVVGINMTNVLAGLLLAGAGVLSASNFAIFVLFVGLCGATYSIESTLFTTVVQENIKQDMLGRVFSMYYSLIVLPSIFGLLSTGFLSEWLGINLTFVVFGALVTLIGILSFFIPALMGLDSKTDEPEE